MIRQITYTEYTPEKRLFPLVLMLDDANSPTNVGAMFRVADTLGVSEMILSGDTPQPPYSRHFKRAARGAEKHVPFRYFDNAAEAIQQLRTEGYAIIALEIATTSVNIQKFDFQQYTKICLIAGSEDTGISDAVLSLTDAIVHIPTYGFCLSMNVATSVAVGVYEITRQFNV